MEAYETLKDPIKRAKYDTTYWSDVISKQVDRPRHRLLTSRFEKERAKRRIELDDKEHKATDQNDAKRSESMVEIFIGEGSRRFLDIEDRTENNAWVVEQYSGLNELLNGGGEHRGRKESHKQG